MWYNFKELKVIVADKEEYEEGHTLNTLLSTIYTKVNAKYVL